MPITDWDVFRAACLALISGYNPYSVGQGEMLFFNPIWTLIPLIPMAILPKYVGLLVNAIVTIFALLIVSRHLKLTIWEYFFITISPMNLQAMLYGNIEWIPLLGVLFPAPLAMVFYATKPQATIGLMLLTILLEWKRLGWKGVLLGLLPTFTLAMITISIWGLPPVPGPTNPGQRSLFPFSLIIGLPALLLALKKSDLRMALFVGPFVSPYVTFHGYLPALFLFRGKWMALAVLVSFIPVILNIVA
jgi:hypothetical protein